MAHPVARAYLESTGRVYSFRTSDRTTGETHYRYERTGTKQGDVEITQKTDSISPTRNNLRDFAPLSGFSTVREWQEAISDVHGSLDESGYVYLIQLTGESDE